MLQRAPRAGLRAGGGRVRVLWSRARRLHHRRRARLEGLRLRAAGVPRAGGSAVQRDEPRQGALHLDRVAEQGRVREADPAQVPGTDLSPPEVAAPHPDLQERGAVPRAGPYGDQHDGLEDGPPAPRARERRGPVPQGLSEEPRAGPVHRRGRRGDPVRGVPTVQRPADPRRDRGEDARGPEVNRPHVPDAGAGAGPEVAPPEPPGLHREVLQPPEPGHGGPEEGEGHP